MYYINFYEVSVNDLLNTNVARHFNNGGVVMCVLDLDNGMSCVCPSVDDLDLYEKNICKNFDKMEKILGDSFYLGKIYNVEKDIVRDLRNRREILYAAWYDHGIDLRDGMCFCNCSKKWEDK